MPDGWPARPPGVGQVCLRCAVDAACVCSVGPWCVHPVSGVCAVCGVTVSGAWPSVGKWAVRVRHRWPEMGHLILPSRRGRQRRCQTQDVGVGISPTPTWCGGEPPGTRTLNPLIKSQPMGGDVPPTRSLPGFARFPRRVRSPIGQLFDGHSGPYCTEIRPNTQAIRSN